MATSTRENKRLARRVPEDIATGRDLDLVDEVFAEDAVEHGPFGRTARGREEIRESLRRFLDAFPDVTATVEDDLAEGSEVAMRVTLSGTHEGPFMGVEPTGNAFEVQNMVFTRVEGDEIAERWIQPDTLGMLSQLGIVESPFE